MFITISEQELRKIVLNSPCNQGNKTFLIKENIEIILPSLNKLVIMSLSQGIFQTYFKNADVIPLLKTLS
jgi:hypothetical protein